MPPLPPTSKSHWKTLFSSTCGARQVVSVKKPFSIPTSETAGPPGPPPLRLTTLSAAVHTPCTNLRRLSRASALGYKTVAIIAYPARTAADLLGSWALVRSRRLDARGRSRTTRPQDLTVLICHVGFENAEGRQRASQEGRGRGGWKTPNGPPKNNRNKCRASPTCTT